MDKSRDKSQQAKRKGRPENLIPGAGRGPKKGATNAGRPPDWWKAKMRELRDRWLVAAEAHAILDDPDHPEWFRVGKVFHEAIDGRPTTPIEVSVNEELADALKLARERATKR